VTRQCEIVEIIGTAVLFGTNMLDVVSEFAELLKKTAILTPKAARWRTNSRVFTSIRYSGLAFS
jgi:hypothetical protein